MVTFDKGARVPRLDTGVTLDARQVGILLSQSTPAREVHTEGQIVRLTSWDEAANGGVRKRLEDTLEQKGNDHPQTLLLALGLDLLRGFEVDLVNQRARARLVGTRAGGFKVEAMEPMHEA